MKPVTLCVGAIENSSATGDIVAEPFLGSGTTLIAAERTGRRFRGLDIDPAYVDVAVERWCAMTGGTPRLDRRDT
jgi:DNA modification methylase